MNKPVKIKASPAYANFRNLETNIAQLTTAGIGFIHVGFMDGGCS